jgi:adenine/guanine phosphoribosyltransferase-like PRPP-binding protein
MHMRKAFTAVVTAVAMGVPVADAVAAAKNVVT